MSVAENACCVKYCWIMLGKEATIPPKIMIDMPLPMPFSVMSSPNHTRKAVPVVNAADRTCTLQEHKLAVPLSRGERNGEDMRILLYPLPAKFPFLGKLSELGNHRNEQLQNNLGGDIGINTHGSDAQVLQRSAAE
ncbi:MAG: hypothetical protein HW397_241 [Dehalococcoidia bacterium]|nr:hypothetical protein [Dehalococcoidia bacterium]